MNSEIKTMEQAEVIEVIETLKPAGTVIADYSPVIGLAVSGYLFWKLRVAQMNVNLQIYSLGYLLAIALATSLLLEYHPLLIEWILEIVLPSPLNAEQEILSDLMKILMPFFGLIITVYLVIGMAEGEIKRKMENSNQKRLS